MGVGDLSVGRRVRRLAEIFSGRARAYRDSIARGDEKGLCDAVRRNIFTDGASEQAVAALADYALECVHALDRQPIADLAAGRILIPDLPEKRVMS
jgi:cytochrome b pre-mRNA-processing protein 3